MTITEMSTVYANLNNQLMIEVKSKYDAEFRRFGLNRQKIVKFDDFYTKLENLHGLNGIQFNICYTDKDGDLLPINNDNNLARVLNFTIGILRLIIQRKGECYNNQNINNSKSQNNDTSFSKQITNNGTCEKNLNLNTSYRTASNLISQIKNLRELSNTLTSASSSSHTNYSANKPFLISYPEDFRPVSAIIDVDLLPDTLRRVRLHKHKSSKPLGFYIRDGRSLRVTPHGVEQVPGIFISRLMPGGLAESTGLLSVNDEVIEVNGIEVSGKTLDQVTDMMVANSSNLIITVKPTNQRYNLNRNTGFNNQSLTDSFNKLSKFNKEGSNNELNIYENERNRSAYGQRSYSFNNKIQNLAIDSNSFKIQETGNLTGRNGSISASSTVSSVTTQLENQINLNQIQHQKIDISALKSNIMNEKEKNLKNEFEEELDEDDDEEIHEADENGSPDNSDDKVLTL